MHKTYDGFKAPTLMLSAYDKKRFEKQVKQLLKGDLKESEIIQSLFDFNYDQISEAVQQGYGEIRYEKEDLLLNRELLANVAVFSAFKSYRMYGDLQTSMIDSNGNKLPFNEFRKKAQEIDASYNEEWLRAEYNLAIKQASAAKQWQSFQRDKDVYPNLKYMPSLSADPREVHRKYYGVIKPIDDAFWNNMMPPNGWGCKCWVSQTDEKATQLEVDPISPIPGVEGNAGKSRRVFPPNHPYVTNMSAQEKLKIQNQLGRLWDNSAADRYVTQKIGKGKLSVHPLCDAVDLDDNLDFGSDMVEALGGELKVLKHSNKEGVKNPEYEWKNTVGDRTKISGSNVSNFVKNSFKDKYKKDAQLSGFDKSFLALDFDGKLNADNAFDLTRRLKGDLANRSKCEFVVLRNNQRFVTIKNSESFGEMFEKIKKELLK